jgi:K+-sensing histidine kinase KdpD
VNVAAEAVLLLVAATLCATAAFDRRVLRGALQAGLIAAAGFAVWAGSGAAAEVAFTLVLMAVIASLSTRFAGEFRSSGQAERVAREAAERRRELLDAVRPLPDLDLRAAAEVTTAALRALGAVAAGVVVVRDDRVVPVDLNGVPPADRLLRVGEGVSGRAIAEDRTLVFHDYQDLPERFDHLPELRSTVSTPIHIGTEVVGAIMAARGEPGPPTSGEVEVIEVLAAHLGAVLATRRQMENQRTLLRRMGRLETMRSAFVDEVSDELRDPLTVIRGAADALRRHGDELPEEDRRRLVDRLCLRADELRDIVNALLDFSRSQADQRAPAIQRSRLGELLSTFGGRLLFDGAAPVDVEVEVDTPLARSAIELILGGHVARAHVSITEGDVELAIQRDDPGRPTVVRSLVAQLAVEAGATFRDEGAPTLRLPRPAAAGTTGEGGAP